MERARHRKSKSASGIEGIRQIQKQNAPSRLSSDSRSYIDGSTRDDMLMLELEQRSVRRAAGTPMKKLLAEEMSKEVESKRRSPSVIARLMGLEGLPSPRHVHRQQKRSSDTNHQKNVSINIHPHNLVYDGQSNRRRSMEQQEFKDVYEDLEASHVMNRRCSSRWSASSILTKPEMALIHQKFIDAKRLSTDEKLQDSKELDDTLELLDSNKDLLLKLLKPPDSLFENHFHDVRIDPATSLGSRIAVLKPSNSVKSEGNAKAWKSERDTSSKYHLTSHLKRKDGLLLEEYNHQRVHSSSKSSKIQLQEKNEEKILPTRIVVLKPNLGRSGAVGMSASSPDHSHVYQPNFEKMKEHPSDGYGEVVVSCRRNNASRRVGLVKPMSKEAREMAREITRRMKDGYDDSVDAKYTTAFRGYAGDESSYDDNESDFDSDLEVFKLSSRKSFSGNKLRRCPSSSFIESSVNTEGKKRLSERWNMTQRYQDLEMVGNGSTLGEMLALPDREIRHKDFDNKMSLGRESRRLSSKNGNPACDGPSGISSSEGWKDENRRTSSRSRSVGPSIDRSSHRRSSYHDELAEEKHLLHSNPKSRGKSKFFNENLSHKEHFSASDAKSRSKKTVPHEHVFINETDTSSEGNFQIQMKEGVKDLSEKQPMFQMAAKDETCDSPVHDVVVVSEHRGATLSPSSSVLLEEPLPPVIDGERSAAQGQENSSLQELQGQPTTQLSSSLQCLGAEPESSESSKEADHPSPVSVLGVPFTEDTSSSESFERVSAELHELRIQLQLLKMESGTCPELSPLVPIEEEVSQLSPNVSELNYISGSESWEISYALDLLIDSGLEESDFNMFRTTWHSPSCPLDPKLFEKLEKKYRDETSGSKSERKFLFDRINLSLVEIFEEHVDSCPWVMPKLAGFKSEKMKEGIRDAIVKLINEGFADEEITDRVLDGEMQWKFSKSEIDVIGTEIEKLLIDAMIAEVVCN